MLKITLRRCRTTLAAIALATLGSLSTGCIVAVDGPSDETAPLDAEDEAAVPEQEGANNDGLAESAQEPIERAGVDVAGHRRRTFDPSTASDLDGTDIEDGAPVLPGGPQTR